MVSASCCSSTPSDKANLHQRLADLLRRYDVNEYAASVRVYRRERKVIRRRQLL